MPIKLIDLNIEGNKHLDKIIPLLKSEAPDVICLQEVFAADLLRLEKTLSFHTRFVPLLQITRENAWDFPFLGQFGLAILSRLPIKTARCRYYRGRPEELPEMLDNPDAENRVLVTAEIKHQNKIYTICTTHFVWALPHEADVNQAPYLKKLLHILKPIGEFILTGDFNAPRGLKTFNTLASLYQDNIPVTIDSTLDPELHRVKDKQLVVDGLFTTPQYQVKNIRIISGVSDHKAIVAEIEKL